MELLPGGVYFRFLFYNFNLSGHSIMILPPISEAGVFSIIITIVEIMMRTFSLYLLMCMDLKIAIVYKKALI